MEEFVTVVPAAHDPLSSDKVDVSHLTTTVCLPLYSPMYGGP